MSGTGKSVGFKTKKAGMSAEGRKKLVAELAMKRLTVREISAALAEMPEKQRPVSYSSSVVGRDLKELREEWATARKAVVEEMIDEGVARLNALEKVWWPLAVTADKDATDRVLAIQRQRAQFLRIGPGVRGGVSVTAGAAAADGAAGANGPVSAVKIRVELVDDWRDA
ncbi:MAG: hypothetical protein ACR2NO_09955 [Chloroflexota bacterium]